MDCLSHVNCSQSTIITPGKSGAQQTYLKVHAEGINATLTITAAGGINASAAMPVRSSPTVDEKLYTLGLYPANTSTAYTVTVSGVSLQPGATVAKLGIASVALGGQTAGNIPDSVLSTASYYGGQSVPNSSTYPKCDVTNDPGTCVGTRVHMADPSSRIPTPTNVVSVGLMDDLQVKLDAAVSSGLESRLDVVAGYRRDTQLILRGGARANWVGINCLGGRGYTFGQRANPADFTRTSGGPCLLNNPGVDAVITNDSANASDALRSAQKYYIVNAEITSIKPVGGQFSINYQLVYFGGNAQAANDSQDIIFMGDFIHGDTTKDTYNGVYMNYDRGAIYDSCLQNFTNPSSSETHALLVTSAAGPHLVRNSSISAGTEASIYGGQVSWPYQITRDIEFDHNYVWKPVSYTNEPGAHNWDVKNSLEWKEGQFISVHDNVFQWGIAGTGQVGQSHFFRSSTYQGAQISVTSNVDVYNETIIDHSSGIQIEAIDSVYFAGGHQTQQDRCGGFANCDVPSMAPKHFAPLMYNISISNIKIIHSSFTEWGLSTHGQSGYGSNMFMMGTLPQNLRIRNVTASFDSATDIAAGNYVFNGGGTAPMWTFDHGFLIDDLGGFTMPESQSLFGKVTPSNSYQAALDAFAVSNSIIPGQWSGSSSSGANLINGHGTWTNNALYWLTETTSYSVLPGSGNTLSTSQTIPTPTAGQGVNAGALPDQCSVITGNRSDISCTPIN